VGDIDNPGINYALWKSQAGGESRALQNSAMPDGYRKQDFILAGSADTKGPASLSYNLKLNWNGARPALSTDAFMLSYASSRLAYLTPNGDTISAEDRATISTMLGMNLPILSSIGLRLEFYNSFQVLGQAPNGLGNTRFIQSATSQRTDGQSQDQDTEQTFPVNFPPSILDSEAANLEGLILSAVDDASEPTQ
jgi:hypothetical protein